MSLFSILLHFSMSFAHAQQGTLGVDNTSDQTEDNVYIIQQGDTLWDIANKFYRSSEQWPSLWSFNEYITNPHWIYPGNRIVFTMGSDVEPPNVDLQTQEENYTVTGTTFEKTESTCGPDVRFDFQQDVGTFTVTGFIKDPNQIEVFGVVEKSPHNHSMLVDKDLLYIKTNGSRAYECGDVVSIFRKIKDRVRDPSNFFSNYGAMYKVVGEAQVVYTPEIGDYITVQVRKSWEEIERGDFVGDLDKNEELEIIPVIIQEEVDVPDGEGQATIIAALGDLHSLHTTRHTLFIDKGEADGVKFGDTYYVTKRRDDYIRGAKDDPTIPATVIGRVMVVRVGTDTSAIIITDARRSIDIGDTLSQSID
ncbi:MAG: LysM domain-containing protein [Myxococcota bacterium]|nr:LysM domain-containing protein [Myxococcota bacterium]